MGDLYLEKIVRRAPTIPVILLRTVILFGAAAISWLIMVIVLNPESGLAQFSQIFLLLVAAILFFAYRLFTSFNIEHEYIVTNGEIDIDKIVSKRTRKRLCTIPPLEVEIMAPYDEEHKHYYDNNGEFAKTFDTTASKYSKDIWLIVANTKKYGRLRVLFEPTDRMIENMREHMPRKVELPKGFVLPSEAARIAEAEAAAKAADDEDDDE